MALVQTANKDYWQHFVFSRVFLVSRLCLRHAFFRHGPVFVLLIIIIFFDNQQVASRLDRFENNF